MRPHCTCFLLAFVIGCAAAPTGKPPGPQKHLTQKGCAIIVTDDDIPSGSPSAGALYVSNAALGKRLLTADVVATARGFQDGGFRCVQVVDSHNNAIDPKPLQAIGVLVLTPAKTKGWFWPFIGPMKDVTAAALVGFHSNAGQEGFRPHTINDNIRALRLDGQAIGEVTHLMLGLGAFGVPVVLVSGDMNATAEAARANPAVAKITVRWYDAAGGPAYLTSEQAATKLRAAAHQGAIAASKSAPYLPAAPMRLELETFSKGLMAARAASLARTYNALLSQAPAEVARKLSGFDFAAATVRDRRLSWRAPDALTGFVSIVFAASQMRVRNWDKVGEGFDAYKAGDFDAALAAYEAALKIDPQDSPTRCRIGAVLRAQWRFEKARAQLLSVAAQLDELRDDTMKSWCLIELASAKLALGDIAGARIAAKQLLRFGGRRATQATTLLALISKHGDKAREVFLRLEELRLITKKIESIYSYLDIKQKRHKFSYDKLKANIEAKVRSAASEADYRKATDAFLARFHDGHLRIKRASPGNKRQKQPPAVSHRWMTDRVLVTRVRRLWGNQPRIARQLAAGVKQLRRAKALVIDLRGNGGGNDALAFDYIAKIITNKIPLGKFSLRMSPEVMRRRPHYKKIYTLDPQRRGFSKWRTSFVEPQTTSGFAGPIAVVIDKGCYSSCEGFALALKNSGPARLFGQNTGGGSANPILIELPRTGDQLMIPTWIQIMPDGDLLEDNGVPPDVRLPAKRAFSAALAYVREQLR